jgi:hypothetical protein
LEFAKSLRIQFRKAKKRSAGAAAVLQQAELELALATQRARKRSVGLCLGGDGVVGFLDEFVEEKGLNFLSGLRRKGF